MRYTLIAIDCNNNGRRHDRIGPETTQEAQSCVGEKGSVNEIEKPCAVLPHWSRHNQEHAGQFATWAQKASLPRQEVAAHPIRSGIRLA